MSNPKTIGIITARMTSTRLPGKVLKRIQGKPLLDYTLERLKQVSEIDEIWLATTQHPSDEQLMLWGIERGIKVYAYPGEMDDVVGRITSTLSKAEADRFIGVLGDTPFPDSRIISRMLQAFEEHPDWDAINVGSDAQGQLPVHSGLLCYRTSAWQTVDQASQEPKFREHPGSILNSMPDLIHGSVIVDEPLYYEGPYRLTVDTQADFYFIESLVAGLKGAAEIPSLAQIITHLKTHPELVETNHHVCQKNVDYRSLKILIAVQAGSHYGVGHLERCKTLARALEEYFCCGITLWLDNPPYALKSSLTEEGWNMVDGNWSLAEAVRQGNYDRVVIDFQQSVTPTLIQGIRLAKPELPIIILDNNGLGCVEADAVIFPNVHALPNPEWANGHPGLYQGKAFVLLGDGFLMGNVPDETISKIDRPTILVTMGGSDPNQYSERILEALKDLKDCHIDLVVPTLCQTPESLEKIATHMLSTITLHWRVSSLRGLMERASFAVTAFGITAYELAFLGVPSLMLAHDDHDVADLERFVSQGSAISLGSGKALNKEAILSEVSKLIENQALRQSMGQKGQSLIDKKGSYKVAETVVSTTRIPVSVT